MTQKANEHILDLIELDDSGDWQLTEEGVDFQNTKIQTKNILIVGKKGCGKTKFIQDYLIIGGCIIYDFFDEYVNIASDFTYNSPDVKSLINCTSKGFLESLNATLENRGVNQRLIIDNAHFHALSPKVTVKLLTLGHVVLVYPSVMSVPRSSIALFNQVVLFDTSDSEGVLSLWKREFQKLNIEVNEIGYHRDI